MKTIGNIKNHIADNIKSGSYISGFFICMVILLCCFLQGCKSETIAEPNVPKVPEVIDTPKLYVQFKVALPSGSTRSETDTDGSSDANPDTFPGEYNENVVNDLTIFFCVEENETEVCKLMLKLDEPIDFNVGDSKTRFVRKEVSPQQLEGLVGKEKIHVYMIGNMPKGISFNDPQTDNSEINLFEAFKAQNPKIDLTELGLFTEGGLNIPLSNKSEFIVSLRNISVAELEILKAGYNSENKSEKTIFYDTADKIQKELTSQFENRTMELERMYSRIDYAETGNVTGKPHVFPLLNKVSGEDCPVYVKMASIQPFNIHKQTYLFRHTAEGDNTEALYDNGYNVSIFGIENNSSTGEDYRWVFDSDASYKKSMAEDETFNSDESDYENHFYNILIKDEPNYGQFKGEPIIKGSTISAIFGENKEVEGYKEPYSYTISGTNGRTYYPWRYISENTLPSQASMIRGLSTGIIFRAQICDKDGNPIDIKQLKPYIKGDTEELEEEDEDAETDYPYGDWITIKDDGTIVLNVYEDSREIAAENGAYFLNYYYFIRHNFDENDREAPKPMKFGVVRNNIYRVCVAGFNGIPRLFDPEDPDEPVNDYAIMVELKVLAWTRHNITVKF